MADNVDIIVQDTINEIVVNAAVVVETIDINVQVAVDEVTIIANPNDYIININRIIGEQVQSDWNVTDEQAPDYIKNKPTIPAAQVNSDWNAISGVAQILNKPTIPAAVTKTSDLTNDGEDGVNPFITALDIPSTPTLDAVLTAGNSSQLDALVGRIGLRDTAQGDYGYLRLSENVFTISDYNDDTMLAFDYNNIIKYNPTTGLSGSFHFADLTANQDYLLPDQSGTIALTSDIPIIPTLTSQLTNDGEDGVNPFITLADVPVPTNGLPAGGTAGQILTKVDATDYNATWQENFADWTSVVKHTVKNNGLSGIITKGTAVYVTGSNGTNMLVGRASNASESTSSKTMGLMQSDITTTGGTQTGFVITEGLLEGLNTAGQTAGDPVWLGVNGALIYGLTNKPYAPAHLVFIGIVTKISAGNGEIFVKVQNGFELKEIHDVDLITTTPINGHLLGFDGTLWVNKTIAGWLGYTPANANGTTNYLSKFTGASALGNSLIFDDGTKVGIGTATPTAKLHVTAAGALSTDIAFKVRNSADTSDLITISGTQTTIGATGIATGNTALSVRGNIVANVGASAYVTMGTDASNYSMITGTGNGLNLRTAGSFAAANGRILLEPQVNSNILYYPTGTGVHIFYTATNERMRIDAAGNLGIGTSSPNVSSILDLTSTTKGFLPPRITTVQKNAIATPAEGLVVYDTTLSTLFQYNNSNWIKLTSGNHTFIKPTSGNSTTTNINGTASTTAATSLNRIHLLPYVPAQTITSNFLNINVTTGVATAVARILIYSDLNGVPNTKLYESATLDCSTTSQKSVTTAFTFKAGTTYWIGTHAGVASCTVAAFFVASLMPIGLIGAGTNASSITDSTYVFGSAPATFGSTYVMAALTTPFVTITL